MNVLRTMVDVSTTVPTLKAPSFAPAWMDMNLTLIPSTALVIIIIVNHTKCSILLFLDIDECSVGNGGCEFYCNNTESSYFCSCPSGYSLDSNEHNCTG